MASMLKMVTLPSDGGGDTKFSNMYLAYETLDDDMKAKIEGLKGRHNYATQRKWVDGKPMGMTEKQAKNIPEVVRRREAGSFMCVRACMRTSIPKYFSIYLSIYPHRYIPSCGLILRHYAKLYL